jgi:sulfoxide reductase catalytic subunit YedY
MEKIKMKKIYKSVPIKPSEITPKHMYLNRREFLKSMGIVGAGAALLAACGPNAVETAMPTTTQKPTSGPIIPASGATTDELGDPLNTFEEITNYNNYYEFTTNKQRVAELAKDFKTDPWSVKVYGLVNNPQTFAMEDMLSMFDQEERIYRLRCVEAWSMVIPWVGFPLASLLNAVEPTSKAKYVRFETDLDKDQMPGTSSSLYPWPYQEGLRLDEAMNPLAILATGLYGELLLPQDGAPIRLVVPWKYGFKSIKAIVKIELVDEEPTTLWSTIAPNEYGFYANVNPEVDHPRWTQSNERRIGELGRRDTLMFNGYSDEVAYLYEGMNLKIHY